MADHLGIRINLDHVRRTLEPLELIAFSRDDSYSVGAGLEAQLRNDSLRIALKLIGPRANLLAVRHDPTPTVVRNVTATGEGVEHEWLRPKGGECDDREDDQDRPLPNLDSLQLAEQSR